jgi:two-component system, OmpR family, heavy metal sensor histidine kinase CusS
MSSKTAEADPRRPLPRIPRSPWSITGRLTLFYAASTGLLLALAAGYLHWGLQQSLDRQDRAFVLGKFHVLQLLLREHHDKPDALESEVEHEASAHALLKYYLRVLDPRGRVLLETSRMSAILPAIFFPRPSPLAGREPDITAREFGADQHYLLLTGLAISGAANEEPRILQVALDTAHNHTLLAEYRAELLIVLACGVMFAALAGNVVTRAGLRPLREIAQATRRITAAKLDERVTARNWPVELHDCAAAFDDMLDRLQESFNRLAEFSADIAHALRNPINNLRGETEVGLTRARTPHEYRQILGSSLEEFDRLTRLIEGLLFIARADDPRTAREHVRFPVRAEMEAVREFYEAFAAERGVTVVCDGNSELTGDPMLVRRAISNLLGNALKHTPAGGRITLATCTSTGHMVDVSVADSGSGIGAEHLPRVFDRFYQVDKTRGTAGNGAGLGLAIVRTIMQLHGGSASIESVPGRGTTITLHFPSAPATAPVFA